MYFRTGSNVADLSLDKDGRIDCFEGFDCFFRLPYVLLEWQRGKIQDDGIKTDPSRRAGADLHRLAGITDDVACTIVDRLGLQ